MPRVSRRIALATIGGAVAGLAGCFDRDPAVDPDDRDPDDDPDRRDPDEEPADSQPRYSYRDEFGTVVEMDEEEGVDPTGEESIVGAVEERADDDTLLVFPPGEYLVDRMLEVRGLDHFGMMGEGERGSVVFSVPVLIGREKSGRHRAINLFEMTDGPVFANIDLDQSAKPEAKANTRFFTTGGLEVRDVRIIGSDAVETRDREDHNVSGKLYASVTDSDGTGIVENFVARGGTQLGVYKDSESGCYVGPNHRGELTLRNCEFEGWSDNGVYASRTRGPVRIEGGIFKNNDIANVRLGHPRSSVRDARIVVDGTDLHGTNEPSDFRNPRGVWIESGDMDWSGAGVRNCTLLMRGIDHASAAITIGSVGEFWVEDTTVHVEADGISALWASDPTEDGSADSETGGRIDRLRVTGSAAGSTAVYLRSRPGTTLRDCWIHQPGGGRHGVYLDGSPDCTIEGGSIHVDGYPVAVNGSSDPSECLVSLQEVSLEGDRIPGSGSTGVDPQSGTTHCMDGPGSVDEGDIVLVVEDQISTAVVDDVL